MITIHLIEGIHPDDAHRIRSGLTDKLWEHGLAVERIAVRTDENTHLYRHGWRGYRLSQGRGL